MNLTKVAIDLQAEGEKKVLQLLEEFMILERGRILSPEKRIWFKHIHYLRFARLQGHNSLSHFYSYSSKKDLLLEGEPLKLVTYKELKEILNSQTSQQR